MPTHRVTMVQLPHFYGKLHRPPVVYPLGIGYLVSVLKKFHEIMPMDLWISNSNIDNAIRLIRKNVPDVFCISVYSTQYPYFKELVNTLKGLYPSIKIIAGGPGATFSYNIFLEKTLVDYCVIGEGELTLKELLDNLNSPEDVRGIAYKRNGKAVLNSPREQIKDLDSIPMPDRDFFDIERYVLNEKKNRGFAAKFRYYHIIAGRGCPYNCTYCSRTFSGCRLRSLENINKEIQAMKSLYNIDGVSFSDELLMVNKSRILQICSIMKENDLFWQCQGRINLVDEEILRCMKDARCIALGYGVEAYSQKILDNMKKGIKIEQIIPAIEMTKRIGIKPVIQYMYGFPGEDDATIERSCDFFKKIDHTYIGSMATPFPGTAFYQEALTRNLIPDEEDYLMRLTSGYNTLTPLVNLTDFTDEELLSRRIRLKNRVNRAYFKRHPFYFLIHSCKRLAFGIRLLFINPDLFFSKLKSKLTSKTGL